MLRLSHIPLLTVLLLLANMAAAIPASVYNQIPYGYHIIDSATVDFNHDDQLDYALIIDSVHTSNKKLLIFQGRKNGKKPKLTVQLTNLLKPFSDKANNCGYFTIIGTESDRLIIKYKIIAKDSIGLEYSFTLRNKNWHLVMVKRNSSSQLHYDRINSNVIIGILKDERGETEYNAGLISSNIRYGRDYYLARQYDSGPLIEIQDFIPMPNTDPIVFIKGSKYELDYSFANRLTTKFKWRNGWFFIESFPY